MKKELRSKLRSVLSSLSPEQIHEQSRRAAALLFAQPEYRQSQIMMIFLSLPQEPDTTPIVLQAWQDHKKVVAPQVIWDSRQLMPLEIQNLDEDIGSNQFGMREPIHGMPIPIELIDLVIVPGLGFDPFGNRLGRGRGFYDRFLSKPEFRGVTCGLALEEQVVESIPAAHHDVKVRMLVTNETVRRFDP
ncbi:MAG: 5-formyltetrahydrofolate cyclo-ligase [Planctomycetia bacterium]|nr:5-formyltetrahydrofolate cyclo-ligase [Planctomycetia bacterium]MCC7316000.1 5-formyltetrahydrofolate cyclo-ligase [Planctomycetota bacterium]